MASWISKYAKDNHLQVMEATKPLKLDVSSADSKKANKKDPQSCAYARCAKRTIPGLVRAFFFRGTAYLEFKGKIVRYRLPASVQHEIVAFDRTHKIHAGIYEIKPPAESDTLRAARQRGAKRAGRHQPRGGPIRRGVVHHTADVRSYVEATKSLCRV